MEQKINIAELLKDCPSGMELDCTLWDDVTFAFVSDDSYYPIKIKTPDGQVSLNRYGHYSNGKHSKCIIFPKGKTTWKEFQRPFKDGDIVAFDGHHSQIFIFKDRKRHNTLSTCYLVLDGGELEIGEDMWCVTRYATEEEKEKLFQAIKDNGYHWNEKTKTLEKLVKPKFKVGDKIILKNGISFPVLITKVDNEYYYSKTGSSMPITEQDDWELYPNKFDISTLKSFESRVLVRNADEDLWKPAVFGCYIDKDAPYYVLGGICWRYCIPYEGNEYLLATANDCEDFYKNW